MMNEEIDSTEINDDVDAILAEEEAREGGGAPDAAAAPAPAQPVAVEDYTFNHGGKEIKATRDQIMKWAQMGYDAPNRLGEMNKKIQEWQQKEATLKELETKYGEVDKYARENPQWLQHVMAEYQKARSNGQPADPRLEQLSKEVTDLRQFKNQLEQDRQAEIAKQEDGALDEEISSIKKQYPKIDFVTPDQTGKSLEYKVLEYATANGIRNFKTAFRDFYHDELVNMRAAEAKESVAKNLQQKSRLGIQSVKTAPTTQGRSSVKGKSYNDLEMEAMNEIAAG
jgi:chromosome segregation ATPase